MRFIVIGAGSVGISLCSKLVSKDHDVVLVELEESNLAKVPAGLDIQTLVGNGCSPDVLVRAGINEADYLLAVADIDEVNIAACFVSRLVNPQIKRIARIRDISLKHRDISPQELSSFFDLIINPELVGAEYILKLLEVPGAREVLEFAQGRLRVLGLTVTERSPLVGRELISFKDFQDDFHFLVIAIVRGNRLIVPRGSDKVRAGDIIYTVSDPERTRFLFELAGRSISGSGPVVIWGESGLALHLAEGLEQLGQKVKLIVSDRQKAEELLDELNNTLILCGDGTDQNLLTEEHVADASAFVCASESEEDNILAALLAKRLGTPSTIALVNKSEYLPLVAAIGVDIVVSSRLAAARSIFAHIHPGSVVAEFSLRNFGAGFVELAAEPGMPFVGVPLKEVTLPIGTLIGAIVRQDQVIIPKGSDTIYPGDKIVLFIVNAALRKVEKMIGKKIELFG